MFRKKVTPLSEVLMHYLRMNGLETPLLQKRLIDAWDDVVGPNIVRYTEQKYIKNQTLFVKITTPALKADLNMMRTQLVERLNAAVGSFIIADIKII